MDFPTLIKIFAVLITLKTGVYSILRPQKIAGSTGLEVSNPRAATEIRAVIGGTYTALAIAALIFPTREIYLTLGIVFAVTAIIRLVSMFLDHSFMRSNIYSLSTEAVLAVLFFL
jgi:hypothetical protein